MCRAVRGRADLVRSDMQRCAVAVRPRRCSRAAGWGALRHAAAPWVTPACACPAGGLAEHDHDNTCMPETCLFLASGLDCPTPRWALKEKEFKSFKKPA